MIHIVGTLSVGIAVYTFADEARMIDDLLELVGCNDLEVCAPESKLNFNFIVDKKQTLAVAYSRELLHALQAQRTAIKSYHCKTYDREPGSHIVCTFSHIRSYPDNGQSTTYARHA
jgi:hypothetical protein